MKNITLLNMRPLRSNLSALPFSALILGLALFQVGYADQHQSKSLTIDPVIGQAVFASPELVAQALATAIADSDAHMLKQLFGKDAKRLMPVEKLEPSQIDTFVEKFTKNHFFLAEGSRQYVIEIGDKGWTFPVPITRGKEGWYFDSEEGLERIRIRRIGKNELSVMQGTLAYYDAQLEYAELDRDADGVLEYAQKFLSSEGVQDGLYWETPLESAPSPLGPLFAKEVPDETYFGYRYRILTSQGVHATEGSLNYVEDNNMTRGFALLAWPAVYGDTGVMTFIVNHEGLIYSADFGQDTAELAKAISSYDPGPDWGQEVYVLP